MNPVTFTIDGVEGKFTCDADVVRSYKTAKQLAKSEEDFSVAFDVMERIFDGRDEEYIDRLGGDVTCIQTLLGKAIEACGAKNSQASSPASKGAEAK